MPIGIYNRLKREVALPWHRVHISEDNPDGCWVWQGARQHQGHGNVRINNKSYFTHRLSFLEFGGNLTKEKPFVLHKCNNPPCVNPNHLYAGDRSDNTLDSIKAGTHNLSQPKSPYCPKGHLKEGENLYQRPNHDWKECLKCRRIRSRISK